MSRIISPTKLAMMDYDSSREENKIQTLDKNNESQNYNPSIHIARDAFKKFHSVKPLLTDKIKQLRNEDDKFLSVNQTKKISGSLKIMPLPCVTQENNKIEGKSKLEKSQDTNNEIKTSISKTFPKYKRVILRFIDSHYTLAMMTLMTLFALFASDIKTAFCPISVDFTFDLIQLLIMCIFALEIIFTAISKEEYLWSFFFWLDVIATLSIIQDVGFIFDSIIGANNIPSFTEKSSDYNSTSTNEILNSQQKAQQALDQLSTASRATRILRIVRIIRLIRILKIYKNAVLVRANANKKHKKKIDYKIEEMSLTETESSRLSKDTEGNFKIKIQNEADELNFKNNKNLSPMVEIPSPNISKTKDSRFGKRSTLDSLPQSPRMKRKSFYQIKKIENLPVEEILKESRISKFLSESITKKILTLIVGMLIILPIMSDDFYEDDSLKSYNILSNYMEENLLFKNHSYQTFVQESAIISKYINYSIDPNYPIISIKIDNDSYFLNSSLSNNEFRNFETNQVFSKFGYINIVYSNLKETILTAQLNIGKTLFVCLILGLSAMYFEQDARELVLQPIEVMIEIVNSVSKDPVNANDIKKLKSGLKAKLERFKKKGSHELDDNYEMKVIEKAILKISAFLAIGFGEAGGEILKANLSSGRELNPLIKGKKKTAIFGFCDIRNFFLINESLQEETIIFVNRIAEIVHSKVEKYGGFANKNMGEAFLMVWKFKKDEEESEFGEKHGDILNIDSPNDNLFEVDPNNILVRNTADLAVIGFLSVIKKINKDTTIIEYRKNRKILEKIKDFRVEMGFGLHLGWGIEGAIGSSYKIDASYLSPNVNISARLEAATKQYGVSILISGALYEQLSINVRDICRLIDIVKLKGSNIPIKLYTIDFNLDLKKKGEKRNKILSEREKRHNYLKKKNKIKETAKVSENIAAEILNKRSYSQLLTNGRNFTFYTKWDEAIDHYIAGRWKEAEKFFEDCLILFPSDGPCLNLLKYIRSFDCIAPQEPKKWSGYRILLSK